MDEVLLLRAAERFAATRQLELAESLGSGKDGIVFAAKDKVKSAGVAVKIFHFSEAYVREKRVYRRLTAMAANTVMGFNVPEFLDCDDSLLVLQITIVKRPFVLDFAGAYLDHRPEFSEEVLADWEKEKIEQFEERWPAVQMLMAAFEELGIYLLDVSPGNIAFR